VTRGWIHDYGAGLLRPEVFHLLSQVSQVHLGVVELLHWSRLARVARVNDSVVRLADGTAAEASAWARSIEQPAEERSACGGSRATGKGEGGGSQAKRKH
jgi:hypothetical protein